ncbi:endonuclease/exonuclease/phosphatase family protein [Phyllobacterium sp. 0TCS1.6C]|uniref:endonuclease/exonuclease/phosphatase family protein n=1 Tax=unclassified Phyllobacterium TaxID=2638441 RepID=UPI002263D2CB|nr:MULTISPECIES: endonuclease/exonuclease/phosphatase family protein [unclassified Phyllobacterium]MCX8279540.1 endonuclease/exonuclease/phosphatase family protein [Phyllobacterium sp. 0TCS1.6C]MCX8292269.1 endonuclease/exonuclease/phosphatase family protein [Phyllobacterium sp. 0TCS1.6A]
MSVRIATFNVENLMNRFDFSGFRNNLNQDRTLQLFQIKDENQYRQLEQARAIAHTDDTRQLTALAIAATHADIICLQEVDNIGALNAFEFGYLFKMVGEGYRHKYMVEGNDSRGIDVAVLVRDQTRDGEAIEFVEMTSHAHVTYQEFGLHTPELALLGLEPHERIFKRDCLCIDLRVGGRPLSLFVSHFKSMGSPRNGMDGRTASMPVRMAEAKAVRRIIEEKFGGVAGAMARDWLICGDFNDYRERVIISGDSLSGYGFEPVEEALSCVNVLTEGGFCENLVERRPAIDRWTLYHTRGPQERHLCQLDYVLASAALAGKNAGAVPDIIRQGQPYRTIFPPDQAVERFPRVGWDRPKASDHCPVAVTLDMA